MEPLETEAAEATPSPLQARCRVPVLLSALLCPTSVPCPDIQPDQPTGREEAESGVGDRLGYMGDGREITRKLTAGGPAPTPQGPFAGREGAGDWQEEASPGREARCSQLSSGRQGPMASLRAQGGRTTLCRRESRSCLDGGSGRGGPDKGAQTQGTKGVPDKGAQTQGTRGVPDKGAQTQGRKGVPDKGAQTQGRKGTPPSTPQVMADSPTSPPKATASCGLLSHQAHSRLGHPLLWCCS